MQITVIDVGQPELVKTGKTPYEKLLVSYKNQDGKVSGKTLVSFSFPEVFSLFKEKVKSGDIVTVDVEKNGQHWNWVSAAIGFVEDNGGGSKMVSPAPNKKWVSDEERQSMIMRQNALTNAVSYIVGTAPAKKKPEDVLAVAEVFFNWTHNKSPVDKIIEMEDDVPQ